MRIFYALLILPGMLSAQVLPDQIWMMGTHEIPAQAGYGNTVLRFQGSDVSAEPAELHMNFESTVAVMPDTLGKILFYTNGCHVANGIGDTMFNGAGLNPGEMANWTCPTSGYAAPMGAMALQLPENAHLYYLFHMGVRYNSGKKLTYGPFYYSVIDMSKDGGKGAVISKNNVLVDGILEPFSAVRHGNGRDWWLIIPEYGTNKYHQVLFSDSGIDHSGIQEIGTSLTCRYIGSTAFSPNGIRYARQQHCGVVVLDFDRCLGVFHNARSIEMPARAILGGGVAFNKDGNKLLVATQLSIQEVDLTVPNPVLDTITPSIDIAGSSLLLMQYAPNGKIYLNNMGRTQAYHVLHTPNESDIGFEQRGLTLPVHNIRSLPNYPNFRLYDVPGSICDTLGINAPLMVNTSTPKTDGIPDIYPNPFTDELTVELPPTLLPSVLSLFDQTGRLVLAADITHETTRLPGLKLPKGIYFWEIKMAGVRLAGGTLMHLEH